MGYVWDFGFLLRYAPLFGKGVLVTLAFTGGTILAGLVIGLVIGIGRLSNSRLLNLPLLGLIELFRCTPLLVQLVWFYYALPVLLDIQVPANVAAGCVLSLYTAAFYAEIFRGGIISIDHGQWDAARALGLTRWRMMREIILPQAVRRMVPPFVNQSITQLKNTSLVSTIAVPDLLYQGTLVTADTYRPLEVYTAVAAIYFVILFPTTLMARWYEHRSATPRWRLEQYEITCVHPSCYWHRMIRTCGGSAYGHHALWLARPHDLRDPRVRAIDVRQLLPSRHPFQRRLLRVLHGHGPRRRLHDLVRLHDQHAVLVR